MTQGTGGPGEESSNRWPSYPGGPEFEFREAGPESQPPAAPEPQHRSQPPGAQPQQPPTPAYPRQKANNSAAIAIIVTLGVLVLIAVLGLAGWFLIRPSETISPPVIVNERTPTPEASAVAPTDPLPTAPPGEPATGALKERLDARYGTFEPIRRDGTGPATIELPPEARRGILWAKTDGEGWFSVKLVRENGSSAPAFYSGDPLEGAVPYGIQPGDEPVRVTIEGPEATWELELRPVSTAPVFEGTATGSGMSVLVSEIAELMPVQLDYRGDSNFIVVQYRGAGDDADATHHSNEIGATTADATFEPGLSVIEVEAWSGGDWAISED
ncbi:MAG: hypothetical protein Q4F67_01175 [Propionibacteriaceae bacterium]|nr:hypothetical protein [Propionibacteriaceae bacterium]